MNHKRLRFVSTSTSLQCTDFPEAHKKTTTTQKTQSTGICNFFSSPNLSGQKIIASHSNSKNLGLFLQCHRLFAWFDTSLFYQTPMHHHRTIPSPRTWGPRRTHGRRTGTVCSWGYTLLCHRQCSIGRRHVSLSTTLPPIWHPHTRNSGEGRKNF